MKITSKLLGGVSAIALTLVSASPAMADGTPAGSTIQNTASVDYRVNNVSQTAATGSDSFIVDRKINLTVEEVGNVTTSVGPGQTEQATTFRITNLSNAALDFDLLATQANNGATTAHGGTDSFNVTNVRYFLDNGDNVYGAGDTEIFYLDEIAADNDAVIHVVADIPLGLTSGDVAGVTLTATAAEAGTANALGATVTETAGANTANMDTVFVSAVSNGGVASASDSDDYTVQAAGISVDKTSRLISDPVNGASDPKFIPGAIVEYCIAVSNSTGSATATDIAVSDTIPTTVTYDATFGIRLNGTVDGSGACLADGTSGGSFSGGTVSGPLQDLAGGDTRTLLFRATIN